MDEPTARKHQMFPHSMNVIDQIGAMNGFLIENNEQC